MANLKEVHKQLNINYPQIVSCLILCLFTATIFSQTKFEEQKVGHVYYMSVPDYMSKTLTLHDNAGLQYMNSIKEAYVLVIDEAKSDLEAVSLKFSNVQDYYDFMLKNYEKSLTDTKVKKAETIKINGYQAIQTELRGKFETEDKKQVSICYLLTAVETKNYFYQIACWSTDENRDKLREDFKKMVSSLREE